MRLRHLTLLYGVREHSTCMERMAADITLPKLPPLYYPDPEYVRRITNVTILPSKESRRRD